MLPTRWLEVIDNCAEGVRSLTAGSDSRAVLSRDSRSGGCFSISSDTEACGPLQPTGPRVFITSSNHT